jgi:hypothetical protein
MLSPFVEQQSGCPAGKITVVGVFSSRFAAYRSQDM